MRAVKITPKSNITLENIWDVAVYINLKLEENIVGYSDDIDEQVNAFINREIIYWVSLDVKNVEWIYKEIVRVCKCAGFKFKNEKLE